MAKFKVDTTVLTDRALKLNGLTSRIKSLQDSVNRVTVNLSSCSYYDQFSSALRKVYIDIQTLSNNVQYFSKVLILMLGTVILFSTVSGCSLKKEALVIPKEEAVEARGKELTNVLQAILKERKFNGKSIEWDGIQATLVRDELDDKNILDGRSGLFEVKEIDTATGITLYSFSTPNNEDLFSEGSLPVVDNPEEYILKSSNRYLSLKKQDITNYDALAEESSTDTQLIELDDKSLNTLRTCKLYTGIIQTESGVDLIGFRILTKVEGKSAVCLTYAGTGNYSDILVEAFEIMRGI